MVQKQQETKTMEQEKALQNNTRQEIQTYTRPVYPSWPTSKPGPQNTPPPPGMKPINAMRPEQVYKVDYNQETGEPGVDSPFRSLPDENLTESPGFDQPLTAQEALKRRKKRL